jgi:hypothetical protein
MKRLAAIKEQPPVLVAADVFFQDSEFAGCRWYVCVATR